MTRDEMLKASAENDAAFDGAFVYAVRSTGIYCRPSCKSRRPKAENMLFFDTPAQAEAAGYRPCKRCRPDLRAYQPARELAQEMKRVIEAGFLKKAAMFDALRQLGVTKKRSIEIFKAQYGVTPGAYADSLRMAEARRMLKETDAPILDIACALGFESLSAFYALFGKTMETTPAAYRKAEAAAQAAYTSVYHTDFGDLTISAAADAVTGVRFGQPPPTQPQARSALTDLAAAQLREYFGGRRQSFSVPVRPAGTPFQQQVWRELGQIPFGQTASYQQVAQRIGRPTAGRAVGMANRKNPILILIPCHRVVGKHGALTGYAAGLPLKRRLLELEQAICRGEDEETCAMPTRPGAR
ncbi:MAG: methylated-DNA--[protein]-cysteine S-methyltransferase [Bacillota bacterium]